MDSNHCFGLPKIIIQKKKNIILELNDNNNKFGYYPLLYAIINDNKEMVQLRINYSNKKNYFKIR